MIRDDWDGLVHAWRWWHLECGLVLYGSLIRWRRRRSRTRLYVHIPDGSLTLTIRADGVRKVTIGEPNDH